MLDRQIDDQFAMNSCVIIWRNNYAGSGFATQFLQKKLNRRRAPYLSRDHLHGKLRGSGFEGVRH